MSGRVGLWVGRQNRWRFLMCVLGGGWVFSGFVGVEVGEGAEEEGGGGAGGL